MNDRDPRARRAKQRNTEAVEEASRLPAALIYQVVRRNGQEELERPWASLVWSGLAAGILISFSVLGEALLRTHLPETEWRPLIENVGYSFGFLLVILGRMQLFTENTITTVLPLSTGSFRKNFGRVAKLWATVLTANILGALIAATFIAHSGAIDRDVLLAIEHIASHMAQFPAWEAFWRGIPAGILIAAIVWMLPSTGGSAFWVILLFTYIIALGEFTHVIAGSVEVLYLMVTGLAGFKHGLLTFLIPVFSGNVIGGTAVFTLMAWGQVKREVTRGDSAVNDPETQDREEADAPSGDGAAHRRSDGSP